LYLWGISPILQYQKCILTASGIGVSKFENLAGKLQLDDVKTVKHVYLARRIALRSFFAVSTMRGRILATLQFRRICKIFHVNKW